MNKKEIGTDQFIQKILLKLEQKGFVFLIKTDDFLFDEFLIEKIEGSALFQNQAEGLFLHQVESPSEKLEEQTFSLTYLDELEEDTLTKIFQHSISKVTTKPVYILPSQILQQLLGLESANLWISSCVFLSEEFETISPLLLHNSLKSNLGEDIKDTVQLYFSALLDSKSHSISKLDLFAYAHREEVLGWNVQSVKPDFGSLFPDSFLDGIGNLFLDHLPKSIPLETVELFLRAFVRIDHSQAILSARSPEQIMTLVQAPAEQIQQLLELATTPSFGLLAKRGNRFTIKIPEYLKEWRVLREWIEHEEKSYHQLKQLEALAKTYFETAGTLLSKEQLDQIVSWDTDARSSNIWKEKYRLDDDLITSYLLLSQNNLEESIKKQQKKRSSILKNSIRISIAVSIAFLLSSFTALIAYLERNSALNQQELAIQAKEDADQAREVAEEERLEAIKARQNESSALEKAEIERLLALDAKSQAEIQKRNALSALDMAQKSELEASKARTVAEKNEKLALEAQEIAQINFKTSERLRNQQEARASALEALAHFANEEYAKGIELAQTAYIKNLNNGGFPLQSDIFFALLYGNLNVEKNHLEVDLEFPAKFIAISSQKTQLAVYTINGEIRLYQTQPKLTLSKIIKTGYLQSMDFASETQIIFTNLVGNLSLLNLTSGSLELYSDQASGVKYKSLYKIPTQNNSWIATSQTGGVGVLTYQKTGGIFEKKEKTSGKIQAIGLEKDQLAWAEGSNLYTSNLAKDEPAKLLFTAPSEISSITWSALHASWILGLKGGQILVIHPERALNRVETFSIHGSKISQIQIIPYLHGTELMFSTGYDGSIYIYVLDKNTPFSTSISSRISYPKHKSWVTGFVIDSDQKLAYSISNDRSLKLWPLSIEKLLSKN